MLSFDGHFYETDVAIQLESGYSPYKGPVIFGTVSYEGTLLYFDPNFQPDSLKPFDIREVFPAQAMSANINCKYFIFYLLFNKGLCLGKNTSGPNRDRPRTQPMTKKSVDLI